MPAVRPSQPPRAAVPATGSSGQVPVVRPPTGTAPSGFGAVPPVAETFSQLNEYKILRALGRGGMAHVYLGQRPDGRLAALKLLLPQFAHDQEIVRRFLLEMKATASLRHENVVEILDFGDWRGNYYLATEFMDAGSLRDLTHRAGGRLPPPVALGLVTMLLRALGAAHAQNIVHRDVKPANFLLRSDGTAKLADFGIARALDHQGLTKTGLLMGTPAYMSPEQARGDKVDARSDLFSAGVVLYELVAGFNPFSGPTETASLTKVLTAEAPLLFEVNHALPPYLETIVGRLLARGVADRYQTADEALADIVRAVPGTSSPREAVRAAVVDPLGAWMRWAQADAKVRYDRAELLLQEGAARRPMAILELLRSHALAPKTAAAETRLRELFQGRDPFAPPQNPKIAELELELAKSPANHALLMQLAALHKLELGLVRSIGCYKRALRLRPDDGFAAGQLRSLIGEEADASIAGGHLTLKTMPAPRAPPTLPATTLATAHGLSAPTLTGLSGGLYTPPVDTRSDLRKLLPRLVAIGLMVAVVGGAGRWAANLIRRSQDDLERSTEQLREGIHGRQSDAPATVDIDQRAQALRAMGDRDFAEAAALVAGPDRDKGVAQLDRFRREHPKSPQVVDAAFLIGKAHAAGGNATGAADELSTFLHLAPADGRAAEAKVLLAKCLELRGDLDGAVTQLQAVVREYPTSPFALVALAAEAAVHETRNDPQTAKARWRDVAARTGPSDALRRQAEEALKRLGG